MIWAGSPYAHLIEFSTGLPTGAVSYTLIGNDGSVLLDTTVTPEADAVSHLLIIPAAQNGCAQPLFENRTLVYSYLTDSGVVADRISYRVQKPIPFAASADGVRAKLGVEPHELKDPEVDLVTAYSELLTFGSATAYEATGDRNTLIIIHAIEAIAALLVLNTLQVKIAQRETSGTNEFQRYTGPEWLRIEADLHLHVAQARALLDPTYADLTGSVFAFGTAGRAIDNVTGAAPV